jgi:hypothetical protein
MKIQSLAGASASFWLAMAVTASAVPVTFQVDMSVQTGLGNFTPGTDLVEARGSFAQDAYQNWLAGALFLSPSADNTNIYVGTFDVTNAVGSYPNYKFVYDRASDSSVNWESRANRFFQLPATATNLPVVFFNDITNVAVPHFPITFEVNMGVQIALGNFTPGNVTVAGDAIDGWGGTTRILTPNPTNSDLWEGTFEVTNPIGSTVNYKFTMNSGATWENDFVGAGGAKNRFFIMPGAATNLGMVYFNNVTNIPTAIPLTFQVNLAAQIALGNFDTNSGVVEARGSFNAGSGGAWLSGFYLTNSPANPTIYSGVWVDTNDVPGTVVTYQFPLNNGSLWEVNRSYAITSTNAQTLPLVFFNNVGNLGSLSLGPVANGQIPLSWTAGTYVRLQSSGDLRNWQDVAGTEGVGSASVTLGSGSTFFRLIGP